MRLFLAILAAITFATPSLALEKKVKLYVGTQQNCNEGVVTPNPAHLNCTTMFVGYTIDDASAQPVGQFKEIFGGVTGGRNKGVASRDANYAGGATESMGYVSIAPVARGTKLYVGTGSCNDGVVTTNSMHLGCATGDFGYVLPE